MPQDVGGIHISIWIVLDRCGDHDAIAGVLIGLPTLRLRGDYLAIVTLGFGEILHQAAVRNGTDQRDRLRDFNLTNGAFGINPSTRRALEAGCPTRSGCRRTSSRRTART